MSTVKPLDSLKRLVELRSREVDRLSADMATKQGERARYLGNLERLEQLRASVGASGLASPALALNCADYKQAVTAIAAAHREDLALHEADMALAQQALIAAARRHEVLDQVHARKHDEAQRQARAGEQKQQDDLAAQVWLRGQS